MTSSVAGPSRYGELILAPVVEQPVPLGDSVHGVTQTHYIWRPSVEIKDRLPVGFSIRIACVKGFGVRMYRAADDSGALCLSASLAGLAILDSQGRLSLEHRGTYDKMRFLFQIGSRLRERLNIRRSLSADELHVSPGDAMGSYPDVLPDDFGMLADDATSRWSVDRLVSEGISAAREDGVTHPSPLEIVWYGIDAESQFRPRDISRMNPADILKWLRLVLFDLGPADSAIDADLKTNVFGRLFNAMKRHLDDSTDAFNSWFVEKYDGIVHQIEKRKNPGGRISRTKVREAMIELSFDSWEYVGQTVAIFMQSIASEIEPALTNVERLTFETMYKVNSELGGFPLFLLYEQFPVIQHAILRILDAPHDAVAWGRLRRVLETYAVILTRRRFADRKQKKKLNLRQMDGSERSLMARGNSRPARQLNFTEIAQAFLVAKDFRCRCESEIAWTITTSESDGDSTQHVFTVTCRNCNQNDQRIVRVAEFRQFAKRYREVNT